MPYSFIAASYNVLNPYHALRWKTVEGLEETQDGPISNWDKREPIIIKTLQDADITVACLQEVSPSTLSQLETNLKSTYQIADSCMAPSNDDPASTFGVAILYNRVKVDLIAKKSFYIPVGEELRGLVIADFYDKSSGQRFRVASVHLKGYYPEEPNALKKQSAKQDGLKQLKEIYSHIEDVSKELDLYTIDHFIIAGDFNEDIREMSFPDCRLKYLIDKGFGWDEDTSASEIRSGRKIDWIFHKSANSTKKVFLKPLDTHHFIAASDHRLIATTIELE